MARAWHNSRWLRSGGGLFLGLLLLLLLLPYLIGLERFRPLVVEALEEQTGRTVELETLRLRFLPRFGVSLGNLRIKNPRGFPKGDTLVVDSIAIGLALRPLLRRQVEISSVGIEGVKATLLTQEQGATNFTSLFRSPPSASRRRGRAEPSPVSLSRIDEIRLTDATLEAGTFWSGQSRVHPSWTISGLNLDAEGVELSDPGWEKKLRAEVDLTEIELRLPSLKEPVRFPDGVLRVRNHAAESTFSLGLGSLRAEGSLKIPNLSKPVADFTLTAKELNLAELSALLAEGSGKGPSTPARGAAELLARGSVEVGRLDVPPLHFDQMSGKVRLYTTRVEVDPFSFELYGGRAQGTLGLDLSQIQLPVSTTVHLQGVNVAQAVAVLSPEAKGKLTGTFEAEGRIGTGLGGNPLAGLAGQGRFAVRNGTFPGLDLRGTLAGMAKFLQGGFPVGDTRFTYFGGDYRIASRRVHSQKLDLQSESLEASLGGSFGFDQTLDYSGWGLLTGKSGEPEEGRGNPLGAIGRVFGSVVQQTVGQMRVPFAVRGTFENPKFILAGTPQPVRTAGSSPQSAAPPEPAKKKRTLLDLFKKP